MGITRDRIRNIFLALMVITSFILSYYLWTAGRNIGEEETIAGTTRSTVSLTTHTMSETFRPASIAHHGRDNTGDVWVSHTDTLVEVLDERHDVQNLNQIESTISLNNENYYYTLQSGEWIEFIYEEPIPLGLLAAKFDSLPQEFANQFFDRIVINANDRQTAYFYHMEAGLLYNVSTIDSDAIDLDIFLDEENIEFHAMTPEFLESKIIYLPNDPIRVPYRSYVVDELPNPIYVNNFFPDTSQVDVRTRGNVTRYIDLTKEVSINDNNNTLVFLRQIGEAGQLSPTSRFIRSFEQVERFENWPNTVILSSYNENSNIVSFRREIDGMPVFSSQDHESVSEVNLVESGITHLKLPIRFITTPITIPTSENESSLKELMSGTQVMELINSTVTAEEYNSIQNIKIGYTWQESDEDSQVINFEPNWYVLDNGYWNTLERFLELHREDAYGL